MTAATLALVAALAQVRDAAPASTGTAAIVGAVVTDEQTPHPVRRAVVTLNCPEPRVGRTAVTDDSGRFAFAGLPPGRYSLNASKRGWVTNAYGAKAPGRPGRSIPLSQGERATASIALPRGAVITGTILDAAGGVPSGVTVRLLRYTYQANSGERRLSPAPGSITAVDERGQYRVYGLAPGEYYVAVVSGMNVFMSNGSDLHLTSDVDVQEAMKAVDGGPSTPVTDVPQRSVSLTPVFYPGSPVPAQASPIVVRAGEERSGVDFVVQYATAARVDGIVTSAGGDALPASTQVSLTPNDPSMPMMGFEGFRNARVGPDGRFEFGQVVPGPYLLVARAALPTSPGSPPHIYSGSLDVDVQSEDVHGLSVALADTLTVSGAIHYDGAGTRPPLTGVRVNLTAATTSSTVTVSGGGGLVNADGTFTVTGVTPGRYRLSLGLSTPVVPWMVESATLGGQDAFDGAVEVRQSVSDAAITITDRLTELDGRIDGVSGADYTVVLFAQNHAYWTTPSRRIMTARTAKDGSFTFKRMPPGDYSLAAVDDVEPGEWFDPGFLQHLEPTAIRVTISDGEKKTQDIRVGGG